MDICGRCGKKLKAGETRCSHCEEPSIGASGEVIPPGAEVGPVQPRERDSFRTALTIAVVADLLQVLLFPLFAEGGTSPLDAALDVIVGLAMVRLLGWHWAFLPSFLGEMIPLFDELPCWTLAVLFVRAERGKLQSAQPG